MGNKIKEAVAILLAIIWACVGYEDGTVSGEAKKASVVSTVWDAITSEEGIYIAPGAWRDIIQKVLPLGVNLAVMMLNKFGVFSKSS